MPSPRWRKVLRDLWLNKPRTLLAVLAIAIGIFGVGSILTAYSILTREIQVNFLGTTPASAILYTSNADGKLAEAVEALPGVAKAEARRVVKGRILIGPGEWQRVLLFVIDDFSKVRVATFTREQGDWPPAEHEILIERSAIPLIKKRVGDSVTIQSPNGQTRDLRIGGIVHDPGQSPGWVDGVAYGYITLNTLEWLGEKPVLDELRIVVANQTTGVPHIKEVAYQVKDFVEQNKHPVSVVVIPKPGQHPHTDQMDSLLFLLGSFGLLALILSGILVANIISALLAQQIRQIGAMKAIGAKTDQIVGLYFGTVLLFGVAALAIGIPAGSGAGRAYAAFTAEMLNFNITDNTIPHWVYLIQILVGLSIPLLAAAIPVVRGSRITVREAISDYGINESQFGTSLLDTLITRVQGVSRPLLLSLRNTFRRRLRLALTIGILATGGATFMSAFNVAASWSNTIDVGFSARRYDIEVQFSQPYPTARVEEVVGKVPGVVRLESWSQTTTVRKNADGTDGIRFTLTGLPPASDLLAFPLVEGRWLRPDDTNALVVNHDLLYDAEANLKVGAVIPLKIGDTITEWQVVGAVKEVGAPRRETGNPVFAYANGDYISSLTDTQGITSSIRIVTAKHTDSALRIVTQNLEKQLDGAGINRTVVQRSTYRKQVLLDHLLVILMFLLVMAILVAAVGGLALTSTMSISVMERTREIGIMRSIGASTDDILQIVVVEGLVISLLSWLVALVLALPISLFIGNVAGQIFVQTNLDNVFPPLAMVGWLVLVILIGTIASAYPAWGAARLTVQQVLAYD